MGSQHHNISMVTAHDYNVVARHDHVIVIYNNLFLRSKVSGEGDRKLEVAPTLIFFYQSMVSSAYQHLAIPHATVPVSSACCRIE